MRVGQKLEKEEILLSLLRWLKLSTKGVLFCSNLVFIAFLHPRVHAYMHWVVWDVLFSRVLFSHIIVSVMNSKCSFVTYNYKRLIAKLLKTIHQAFWKEMLSISNFVLYLKDEMKYWNILLIKKKYDKIVYIHVILKEISTLVDDVSASSCRHYQMQIMKFEFRIYSSISVKKENE